MIRIRRFPGILGRESSRLLVRRKFPAVFVDVEPHFIQGDILEARDLGEDFGILPQGEVAGGEIDKARIGLCHEVVDEVDDGWIGVVRRFHPHLVGFAFLDIDEVVPQPRLRLVGFP